MSWIGKRQTLDLLQDRRAVLLKRAFDFALNGHSNLCLLCQVGVNPADILTHQPSCELRVLDEALGAVTALSDKEAYDIP